MSERLVLIVDDEEDVRRSLAEHLKGSMPRVHVRLARDGPEALRILEQVTVHLLITDFRMPGMTGLELLAEARLRWPRMVTVMMTAYPDIDIAVRAVNDARASYFLVKPLDPDRVLHQVADLLWRRYLDEMRDFALKEAVALLGDVAHARGPLEATRRDTDG